MITPENIPAVHIDLSPLGLFMQANWVVKIVMLLMLLGSVASWAVMTEKFLLLRRLNDRLSRFERVFWSGQPLEDLLRRLDGRADHPAAKIFVSALHEWKQCRVDHFSPEFTQQRVADSIDLSLNRESDAMQRRMTILATVGSVTPFVGLFGTVWGIMNSFTSIAASQNTSLAVVAPGIAEALFATAAGLVAAIPAVVAYNAINSGIGRLTGRFESFGQELSGFLAKQSQILANERG